MTEDLIFLEPRAEFDRMVVGIDLNATAVVYDYDALVEYFKGHILKEDSKMSDDEAYDQAVDRIFSGIICWAKSEHAPRFMSMTTWEIERADSL